MLELHERETATGADVWPQVTPRPVTMQMQMSNPYPFNDAGVFRELIDQPVAARLAAYRDSAWRVKAIAAMTKLTPAPRFDRITVSESEVHPELIERRIDQLAG